MKSHQTMNRDLLIQIVIEDLTSRFEPDVTMIKVISFSLLISDMFSFVRRSALLF